MPRRVTVGSAYDQTPGGAQRSVEVSDIDVLVEGMRSMVVGETNRYCRYPLPERGVGIRRGRRERRSRETGIRSCAERVANQWVALGDAAPESHSQCRDSDVRRVDVGSLSFDRHRLRSSEQQALGQLELAVTEVSELDRRRSLMGQHVDPVALHRLDNRPGRALPER